MLKLSKRIATNVALVVMLGCTLGMASCRENTDVSVEDIKPDGAISGEYLKARFEENYGNYKGAAKHYEAALGNAPENPKILRQLYSRMAAAGDVKSAIFYAEKYKIFEEDAPLGNLLAVIGAISDKQWKKAKDHLKILAEGEAKKSVLGKLVVPLIKAWVEVGEGSLDIASEDISKIEHSYFNSFIKSQRAVIYHLEGKNAEAEKIFDEILKEKQPFIIVNQAAAFYKALGNSKKSEELLNDFVKNNAGYKNPEHEMALADLKLPIQSIVLQAVADIMLESSSYSYSGGRIQEASAYSQIALYLRPQHSFAMIMLGRSMEMLDNFDDAIEVYKKAPSSSAFYNKIQLAIAEAYYKAGKTEKALSMLERLSVERKNSIDLYLSIGDILINQKRFDDAANTYSKAIEIINENSSNKPNKKDWVVFYARGISFEQISDWEKAEQDFKTALKLQPDQPDVLNYLAYSWLLQKKNFKKATAMLEKASILRPNDAHIIDSYGWALYLQNQYSNAMEMLEHANSLMPHDPTINDHLGDVYWQLGRRNEAKFQWKRALTFDPKAKEVEIIKNKIKYGLNHSGGAIEPASIKISSDEGHSEARKY